MCFNYKKYLSRKDVLCIGGQFNIYPYVTINLAYEKRFSAKVG